MTDLEITKLCAKAMGWRQTGHPLDVPFTPLTDDAQAMALVKRFRINTSAAEKPSGKPAGWVAWISHVDEAVDANLNHAICLCVAKMQKGL